MTRASLLSRSIGCVALVALVVVNACGGSEPTSSGERDGSNPYNVTATGPGVLSVSPLDTATVFAASPLGKLAPPGHTLPTDHVYINFVDAWGGNVQANDCSKRPIYAAGSGVVDFVFVTEAAGDTKVDVQMTKTFHYYYDHVLPLPGIGPGVHVDAGQQIATTTGRCPSIDLGVWDMDVTLPGIINAARYPDQTKHAASPYKYFMPALRAFYLSKSRILEGVPYDREGRIDFGVAGHLIGDWFHSSLAENPNASSGPEGWPKELAFARDWYDGRLRVSIGGVIGPSLVAGIAASDPDPAAVSTASGMVTYQLTRWGASAPSAWLVVQMTADDRIKVQMVPMPAERPSAFTSAAQEYRR